MLFRSDTLEELRADLRTRLRQAKVVRQGAQARDEVLKALLATTEVPLPESIVDFQFESRMHDALNAFEHDKQRLGRWLEEQGQTEEEFETDLRNDARETVKAHLMLDTIADAEKLSVTQGELSELVMYQARRQGVDPNDYAQKAHQSGQLSAMLADVRRGKALATVVRQATVTDASGNPVDVDSLVTSTTPS